MTNPTDLYLENQLKLTRKSIPNLEFRNNDYEKDRQNPDEIIPPRTHEFPESESNFNNTPGKRIPPEHTTIEDDEEEDEDEDEHSINKGDTEND